GIPHQNFYPLNSPQREAFYDQVYRWFPNRTFARVLVIGAGNGTDVDGALARGATSVDAVEIDPRILDLGERLHPDRPYADPRVREIVDDGRAVLRRTDQTYDLIVLALTDSLTLSSTAANLRLESFLYTEESLAEARDHLAPDGVLVIYNYYDQPFLIGKLAGMLNDVFGAPPIVRTYAGPRSEEHTSELQSRGHLVCRLLLEKKNQTLQVTLALHPPPRCCRPSRHSSPRSNLRRPPSGAATLAPASGVCLPGSLIAARVHIQT